MKIQLVNYQRRDAVPLARLTALARRAVQRLRLNGRGHVTLNFIDSPTMRALHRRFIGHHRLIPPRSSPRVRTWKTVNAFIQSESMLLRRSAHTKGAGLADVLSFRYPHESVVGEILIAPAAARHYANAHRVSYEDELARYVVHGLLHWCGHEDRTPAQQRKMRQLEDSLLAKCALRGVR